MKNLVALLALCCAGLFAQGGAKPAASSPVELSAETSHHLKVENEFVRAYYVEVAPGQSTLMHHHGTDYVSVAFGAAEVDSAGADGATKHISFQDGQMTYSPAGLVHMAVNRAPTPFRAAAIELLQNQGHPVCVKGCEGDPRAKDWPALPDAAKAIGYGDNFRIIAVDVKPQQTISIADPAPHLGMFLSDVTGRFAAPGQPPQDVRHPAHEIVFHQPHPDGTTVTNTGKEDMRIVEIQFKPVKQ